MKTWTILALLAAFSAVFLGVGHTEGKSEFNVNDLEDVYSDTENDEKLTDSFNDPESDDDDDDDDDDNDEFDDSSHNTQTENALESVEAPSNDDDESAMFKRTPGWGRRRRRRFQKIGKVFKKIHKALKKVCEFIKQKDGNWVQKACRFIQGDEEIPVLADNEFIVPIDENDEETLVEQE